MSNKYENTDIGFWEGVIEYSSANHLYAIALAVFALLTVTGLTQFISLVKNPLNESNLMEYMSDRDELFMGAIRLLWIPLAIMLFIWTPVGAVSVLGDNVESNVTEKYGFEEVTFQESDRKIEDAHTVSFLNPETSKYETRTFVFDKETGEPREMTLADKQNAKRDYAPGKIRTN